MAAKFLHKIRKSVSHIGKGLRIAAAALILWPYTLSYSDTNGTFRIVNATPRYIDAKINGTTALFLAPGSSFLFEFRAPASIFVDVSYSPAQGVKGSASRMFAVELQSAYTGTAATHNDCSSSSSRTGNDCSTNSSSDYDQETRQWVDPVRWVVEPDTLTLSGG